MGEPGHRVTWITSSSRVCLAAITLVGGGAGDGVVRAGARCRPGYSSLRDIISPALIRVRTSAQRCQSRSSGSWVLGSFFPFKCVLSQQGPFPAALPSPPTPPSASGGRGRKGSSSHLVWPWVHAGTVPPGLSEPQAVSNTASSRSWKQLPWSHSEALSCISGLCFLHVCSPPWQGHLCPSGEQQQSQRKRGWSRQPVCVKGCTLL